MTTNKPIYNRIQKVHPSRGKNLPRDPAVFIDAFPVLCNYNPNKRIFNLKEKLTLIAWREVTMIG